MIKLATGLLISVLAAVSQRQDARHRMAHMTASTVLSGVPLPPKMAAKQRDDIACHGRWFEPCLLDVREERLRLRKPICGKLLH
jgi:hypothetical protein